MAKLVKPGTVEINGKKYRLSFTLATIYDFEQESGKRFLEVVKPVIEAIVEVREAVVGSDNMEAVGLAAVTRFVDSGAVSASDVATLFWAALGGTEQELTVREAAKLITPANAVEIFRTLFATAVGSLPEPKEDDAENEPQEDDPNAISSTGN